jgi:hypothetical protein
MWPGRQESRRCPIWWLCRHGVGAMERENQQRATKNHDVCTASQKHHLLVSRTWSSTHIAAIRHGLHAHEAISGEPPAGPKQALGPAAQAGPHVQPPHKQAPKEARSFVVASLVRIRSLCRQSVAVVVRDSIQRCKSRVSTPPLGFRGVESLSKFPPRLVSGA